MTKQLLRWLPLCILIIIFGVFLYFQGYDYLTFDALKRHRELLLMWQNEHFLIAIIAYMSIYILLIACSIPSAVFLSMAGGFMFGPWLGAILALISASIGAFIVFCAVALAFRAAIEKKTVKWLQLMAEGFKKNAFFYLIFLRIAPIFPFWVVNIVPALLGVSKRTFFFATLIGMIPGCFIYVSLGSGLGHLFDNDQVPNVRILYDPEILIPLIGLAILAVIPIIYKWYKRRGRDDE